ncbi:primosomal protein [Mycobacterium sp. CBMA271]|uniref:primosomal protein n=1 Tax=unclassified Mycobacteroides TaxID=2618759 RepID=UPI0012DBEF4D|nr:MULTISPECIES: primosomal protein [unclassified Mycobacteroides]MUM16395.1 primosomal protein [Mycobacteroides sp. CBMA 326]MUM20662.1 primosomal protein [Mycobacteroides sp. CBMA 271]
MAADIVPIGLGLTEGDVVTLWAPRWRDAGDEWEAFLGKDDDLYVFESVADLVAFVRTDNDNDLVDHPAWSALGALSADELEPDDENRFDLIGVPELVADKPSEDAVDTLRATLAIVASIGAVCELAPINKLINGNPVLATLSGGAESFTGKDGLKRWNQIGTIVGKSWDAVVDSIDEIAATPDVDEELSAAADAELLAAAENAVDDADDLEDDEDLDLLDEDSATSDSESADDADDDESEDDEDDEGSEDDAEDDDAILGGDEDFWLAVGIDPIQMITNAGTFYTLRCYLNDEPIFLGRNGRISVFGSERALARYLADEHDHDLSDLSTYDDIRTAATDGSLRIDITDDNIYVFTGLADDLEDGLDEVDRDQLELAVELLTDVAEYSEEDSVDAELDGDTPLGKLVGHLLEPDKHDEPKGPFAEAAERWRTLERAMEARLRRE